MTTKATKIEKADVAPDSAIVARINTVASDISELTGSYKEQVNMETVELIKHLGERMIQGVTIETVKASIKASNAVEHITVTKAQYFPVAVSLMAKDESKAWDSKELLSVAERVARLATEHHKADKEAPKGVKGAQVLVSGADSLEEVIEALPTVKARNKAKSPAKVTGLIAIVQALAENIKERQSLTLTDPAEIGAIVELMKLLAQVKRATSGK